MATAASENSVQQLYIAYFGRPADPAGLAFYADALDAGTDTLANIADSFALSTEAAAIVALDTDAFLTSFYQNAFGRAYDNTEAVDGTFWADAINAGTVTKEQAMVEILGGASTVDAAAADNKTAVAVTYTTAVTADGATYTSAEIADAQAILTAVTSDVATVATGNTAAAAEVAANVPGAEFALTAALADVDAAEDAIAAFLLAAAQTDAPGEEAALTEVQVAGALTLAISNVDTEIGAAGAYNTASTAVKAALLADAEAADAAALVAANTSVTTAAAAIDAVTGMTAAATTYTAAAAASVAADAAAAAAAVLDDGAEASWVSIAEAGAKVDATSNTGGVLTATVDDGTNTPFTDNTVLTLTTVTNGVVALAATPGAYTTAQATAFQAQQALAADLVAALNATTSAAASATAADAVEAAALLAVNNSGAVATAAAAALGADASLFADSAAPTVAEMAALVAGRAQLETDIDAISFTTSEAVTEALSAAFTTQAVADGFITLAEKTAIDTAFDTDDTIVNQVETDTAQAAAIVVIDAIEADWTTKAGTYSTAVAVNTTLLGNLTTANAAVVTAQTAIDDLATDVAFQTLTQTGVDVLAALNVTLTAANKAITDEGFATPVTLTGAAAATVSDDVYLSATTDAAISSFGQIGDDALFIGSGLTLNADTTAEANGNNAVLEVWMTETAGSTVISVEQTAFGSSSAADEVTTITLTGVAMADVTLVDGLITVA